MCCLALAATPTSHAWMPWAAVESITSSTSRAFSGRGAAASAQELVPTRSIQPFFGSTFQTTPTRPTTAPPPAFTPATAAPIPAPEMWRGGAADKHSLNAVSRHLPDQDKSDVARALVMLSSLDLPAAHQLRARETAEMVAEACGDRDAVLSAILLQAVQDGKLPIEQITTEMGATVAKLTTNSVETIQLQSDSRQLLWNGDTSRLSSSQAENLRNMLITMSTDWRVVTLALVHEVRHLSMLVESESSSSSTSECPRRSREAFIAAREALDVYAPLAHRLGMYQLKNELENLAFKHLYPQQHELITEQLAERAEKHEVLLSEQLLVLKRVLQEDPVFMNNIDSVVVEGRQKSPYSAWRKLLKISQGQLSKGKNSNAMEQVLDAIALRVVLKPDTSADRSTERGEALCYHVLEQVHEQWAHMDFRVKDFIANPKENGYRSLHTTCTMRYHGVVYPFEIQVRTQDMHRVAEWGKAAHFRYKEGRGGGGEADAADSMRSPAYADVEAHAEEAGAAPIQWLLSQHQRGEAERYLRSLNSRAAPVVEVADPLHSESSSVGSAREYADRLHDELSEQRIYVFGSDGKIWDLERGVTVKDALLHDSAHPMHVTGRESSFRVNGRHAREDYELRNGDQLMMA